MATDLGMSTMECDLKKGGAGPGDDPDVAVYKQLVERVRALEESLKKMENEEGGKDTECGASGGIGKGLSAGAPGQRAMYSTVAEKAGEPPCYTFHMPMHYPRYRKADYEVMPEWRLDCLLQEYGLPINVASTLAEKREYAMGVFLWSNQRDN